jgi:hypothetical protein
MSDTSVNIVPLLRPVEADDPERKPYRFEEVFLFLFKNDEGDEGVAGYQTDIEGRAVAVMMVAADEDRKESYKKVARDMANKSGREIEIIRFSNREHIETIAPFIT